MGWCMLRAVVGKCDNRVVLYDIVCEIWLHCEPNVPFAGPLGRFLAVFLVQRPRSWTVGHARRLSGHQNAVLVSRCRFLARADTGMGVLVPEEESHLAEAE